MAEINKTDTSKAREEVESLELSQISDKNAKWYSHFKYYFGNFF
jgi:hypothetical protein